MFNPENLTKNASPNDEGGESLKLIPQLDRETRLSANYYSTLIQWVHLFNFKVSSLSDLTPTEVFYKIIDDNADIINIEQIFTTYTELYNPKVYDYSGQPLEKIAHIDKIVKDLRARITTRTATLEEIIDCLGKVRNTIYSKKSSGLGTFKFDHDTGKIKSD